MRRLKIVPILLLALTFVWANNAFAQVEKASSEQIEYINEGLISGITASNIKAYKSKEHSQAYFVAAELNGGGLNGQFACWLISGTKDRPGMIVSVDAYAKTYSVFPQRKETASISDNSYKVLRRSYIGD